MIGNDIRSLVDAKLQLDQKGVEFNDFLKGTTIDHYCSSSATMEQAFATESTYQLPKHLLSIIQNRRNTTAMGIFPEIQRIWIISGTIVYFWDYINRALFTYEVDDKVYQVGLVKPKAGVFANTVEWVLVVNTSQYITVYGVTFVASGSANTGMELDLSQRRSVQSGGVAMKSIIDHNSRILMLGADDGHIYEMVYKRDSSQDRLVCHTDQGFHTYLGFSSLNCFFKSVLDVKTKSITIDHQRNVVYALSEKSTIQIICLDDGDVTFKFGTTVTDINKQVASFLYTPSQTDPTKMPPYSTLDILGSPLAPKPFDIISVHPVSKQHTPATDDIAFYAVTSHGCRLYFVSNEPNSIITEKSTFTLKYVRLPPYENDRSLVLQLPSEHLESAFQLESDVFISHIRGKSNKLWMTSYQQQFSHGNIKIEETSDVMEYKSTIAIVGQHSKLSLNSGYTDSLTFYERTNTLFSTPHYRLIVVTNDGTINIYKKQRPVDLIYQSIANNTNLDLALKRFGKVETYAMLLNVLSMNSAWANTHQHILLSLAKQDPDNVNQALALIYTRIVANIWKKNISRGDDRDGLYEPLLKCKDDLAKVYTLMNASKLDGPAYENMLDLFYSSIQVILFITLLKKHRMFTSESGDVNDGICFADLVTTTTGRSILEKLLIRAIHYFASTGQGQVMVSTYLIAHCPTLFGDAHRLAVYEGDEYLAISEHLGKTAGDLTQQRHNETTALLEKSLDKYMASIDYINQDTRTRICDTYKRLGYYQGVVTFSMHAVDHPPKSNELTPTLSLLNNTTMTGIRNDDQVGASQSIGGGVAPILSLLDHVNNIPSGDVVALLRMTLPIYSHNMALHHAIYSWLIEHDKLEILFDEEVNDPRTTQYLTQFLEHDYENKPIGMDYLYKYYDRQGDREKMVTCLATLAMAIRGISLPQRIQYLNIARSQNFDQQRMESLHQVALVQQIILDRLLEKQRTGNDDVEVEDRLLSRLLDLDDLLKDYAEKYGLWDQALVLMRLGGKRPDNGFDYVAMKAAWSHYLSQQTSLDLSDFRSQFVALGKQLYPSITTFPVYFIVIMIESYCLDRGAKKGFVIDLLLETGVPSPVLEDAYDFILDNKLSTSDDLHLHQQLDYLKAIPS